MDNKQVFRDALDEILGELMVLRATIEGRHLPGNVRDGVLMALARIIPKIEAVKHQAFEDSDSGVLLTDESAALVNALSMDNWQEDLAAGGISIQGHLMQPSGRPRKCPACGEKKLTRLVPAGEAWPGGPSEIWVCLKCGKQVEGTSHE